MLSYISIILTNFVGIVLTPFIIRQLGDSEYGLYILIGSLLSYIGVLDFGLNNTIVRFVAKYRATNDREGEENFLATTMLIYSGISMVIVCIGIAIYFNLEFVFDKLTPQELGKAKIMFVILIFNLALTLPGGSFNAICSAYERFVYPRTLNIVKYIFRSITVVAILLLGGDAISIVCLDTIVNLTVIGLNGYYVFRHLNVRFKLHIFQAAMVKRIFSYSVWIFIFAMVGQFQWRSGQVILGMLTGTKAVAIYGIGILLGTYYGAFSAAISSVFLPRATRMIVHEASVTELTSMMIRVGRFALISLLMILGGFILFGRQFVHLWVGDYYMDSWPIAVIIMFAYTIPLVQTFAISILEARSKFSFKAIVSISFIGIGTLIGACLVRFFGPIGITIGCTGGWVLSQIVINIYLQRVIGLEVSRFFKELLTGLLPTFIIILIFGYCLNFIPGNSWVNLILKISIFMLLYASMLFKFGMNNSEIKAVKDVLPGFCQKK